MTFPTYLTPPANATAVSTPCLTPRRRSPPVSTPRRYLRFKDAVRTAPSLRCLLSLVAAGRTVPRSSTLTARTLVAVRSLVQRAAPGRRFSTASVLLRTAAQQHRKSTIENDPKYWEVLSSALAVSWLDTVGFIYMVAVMIALLNMLAFAITKRHYFLYLPIVFTICIGAYLGFHRTQIRKKFNISVCVSFHNMVAIVILQGSDSSLDDCVYHLICLCCKLVGRRLKIFGLRKPGGICGAAFKSISTLSYGLNKDGAAYLYSQTEDESLVFVIEGKNNDETGEGDISLKEIRETDLVRNLLGI